MYDLIIRNARVVDGTGAPWYRADVAVEGGRIAAIGKLEGEARETVDAEDHYLAPGFIDIHSHSDDSILACPSAESRILQGVTTEIAGNCGASRGPAPEGKEEGWPSMAAFLSAVEHAKPSVNLGMLVGHGAVRACAMGYGAEKPTEAQLQRMRELVAEAMEAGAFGVSSGLIYPPSSYADTEELIEVAKAAAPYGGYYATHMRGEGKTVVRATEEAIRIAREAGVPLQISHHKVTWKPDWQVSCFTTTAMIERARRQGLEVFCDQYPYRASATTLSVNIPEWAFDGGVPALLERLRDPALRARISDEMEASHVGRWGDIFVSYVTTEENQWMAGRSIPDIAQRMGKPPAEALIDIVIAENDHVGEISFGMCEEDIEHIMKKPYVMTGSDGGAMPLDAPGKPHPRNYGTFVRVLAHYCRERGLFPLETAVHKMTGLPAARLRLADRGAVKQGMWADLVLFDFDALRDTPDFANPQQACEGILKVYVNGVLTAENGRHTGAHAGVVLRRAQG